MCFRPDKELFTQNEAFCNLREISGLRKSLIMRLFLECGGLTPLS